MGIAYWPVLVGKRTARRHPRIVFLTRLVAALAATAVGVWLLHPDRLAHQLSTVRIPLFLLAVGFFVVAQSLSALRWRVLARDGGAALSRGAAIRIYLEACFLNAFLPTGIGGDAYRITRLQEWVPLRRSGLCVLSDRVFGLGALALSAGLLLPLSPYGHRWPVSAYGLAVLAAGVLAVSYVVLARRGLLAWAAWTVGFEAVWCLGLWVLAAALDVHLAPAAVPVLMVAVAAALALPLSLGGTGVREAGFVIALAPLGVSAVVAVALGLLYGVALLLVGIVSLPFAVSRFSAGRHRAPAA